MYYSPNSVSNGNITNERKMSDNLVCLTRLFYRICRFPSGEHPHSNLPGNENKVFLCER